MDYEVKLVISAETGQAQANIRTVNRSLESIGPASQRGLRAADREARSLYSSLREVDRMALGALTAFGGFQAAKMVADMVSSTVRLGGDIDFVRQRFTALAGGPELVGAAMDGLKAKTGGVVSEAQLATDAVAFLMTGVAENIEQAGDIIKMGLQLGGQEGVKALGQALKNGSFLMLDNVGISAAQVRELSEQYRNAGMDSAAAFSRATLEIGQQTVERLGAAANAGITELGKVESWWKNFTDRFAENSNRLAESIVGSFTGALEELQRQEGNRLTVDVRSQAILPGIQSGMAAGLNEGFVEAYIERVLLDIISNPEIERQAHLTGEQVGAMIEAGMAVASPMLIEQAGGASNLRQYLGALADETHRQNRNILDAMGVSRAQQEQMRAGIQELERMALEVQTFASDLPGRLQRGARMSLATDLRQEAYGIYAELGELASGANGFIGGQGLFTGQDLESARMLVRDLEAFHETFKDSGLLSESDLASARQWADEGKRWLSYIEKGVDAAANMTLPQLFGTDNADSSTAAITDAVVAGMRSAGLEDAQIDAYLNAMDLRSGRQSALSQNFYNEVVPGIAAIFEQFGTDAAVEASMAYERGLETFKLQGVMPNDPFSLTGYANLGGDGSTIMVEPGWGWSNVASELGVSLEEIDQMMGFRDDIRAMLHPGALTVGEGQRIAPLQYVPLPPNEAMNVNPWDRLMSEYGGRYEPTDASALPTAELGLLAESATTFADASERAKLALDMTITPAKDLNTELSTAIGQVTTMGQDIRKIADEQYELRFKLVGDSRDAPPWLIQTIDSRISVITTRNGGVLPGSTGRTRTAN